MTRCSWWLDVARAVDALIPDGLVGLNNEDWSLSPMVHCLDHMRRVLDGPGIMRLVVIPCGRCVRCYLASARGVHLGPRASALVTMQGFVWFANPAMEDPSVATPPGWRSARIAADAFVCAVQRARLDLALSLARPDDSALGKRELLRRVSILRARQESAWSDAAAQATRALRWVARGGLGAAELEVAWRGFLASRIEARGVVYDTPLHVRSALSAWRAS